jgi:hypothetical protein
VIVKLIVALLISFSVDKLHIAYFDSTKSLRILMNTQGLVFTKLLITFLGSLLCFGRIIVKAIASVYIGLLAARYQYWNIYDSTIILRNIRNTPPPRVSMDKNIFELLMIII